MKNDQLSVDGAKLDIDIKMEVPNKSKESKCGLSNNLALKLWTGHIACHALLSHRKKCMESETTCPKL